MPARFLAPPDGYTSPLDSSGNDVPGACCSMFSVVAKCDGEEYVYYQNYTFPGGCHTEISPGVTVIDYYNDIVNGNASAAETAAAYAAGVYPQWPLALENFTNQCGDTATYDYLQCRKDQLAACQLLVANFTIPNATQSIIDCANTPNCYYNGAYIYCQAPPCGVADSSGKVCELNCFFGWGVYNQCAPEVNALFHGQPLPIPPIPGDWTPPPVSSTDLTHCCDEIQLSLTNIATAIVNGQGVSSLVPPLQAMADAMAQMVTQVTIIANNAGTPPPGGTVDLSEVIKELQALQQTLDQGFNAPAPPSPDYLAKVQQLISYLQDNYAFDAGAGQIVTS